jgi:hypothetical protein
MPGIPSAAADPLVADIADNRKTRSCDLTHPLVPQSLPGQPAALHRLAASQAVSRN